MLSKADIEKRLHRSELTMWTWNCSACPETFSAPTKAKAQALFAEHAESVHHAKIVVSMTNEAGQGRG